MDNCGICLKPAEQLFETGQDSVYACFKCQPLVPEVTIDDTTSDNQDTEQIIQSSDDKNSEDEAEASSPMDCPICDKTFRKSSQLQNHLRNHRAERRFVCMYCSKAFSQSNNLRAHLRIHTNERPYKCNECGKAFTQVTNLNNHVRLHTGERPFVCSEPGCDKAYAQVTNLNQHRKRHLSGRAMEQYDCPVCGERFTQRNHMYAHRREAHGSPAAAVAPATSPGSGFTCQLCRVSLPTERQLQRHVARHVGVQLEDDNDVDGETTVVVKSEPSPSSPSSSTYTCVFRACGATFPSPRAHTEHLLRAHQLRVLAQRRGAPARRGRPPKERVKARDPLEITEPDFETVEIVNPDQLQYKLKVQSMFE